MSFIPQRLIASIAAEAGAPIAAPVATQKLLINRAEHALVRLREHEDRHGLTPAGAIDPAGAIGADPPPIPGPSPFGAHPGGAPLYRADEFVGLVDVAAGVDGEGPEQPPKTEANRG